METWYPNMDMNYSIYARSLNEAQQFAAEKSWASNEWILFILDIDEPFARLRGYDQAA